MKNLVLILAAIFAVFLISGCTNTQGGTQSTQNVAGANWCPVGTTTTNPVSNGPDTMGSITWNYRSVESYEFPDGTLSLCCMEGHLITTEENSWTRMCVDQQSKHSVQWKSQTGNDYVKVFETYPNGTQECVKTFDQNGLERMENCQ